MNEVVSNLVKHEKFEGRWDFRIRPAGKRGRPTTLCFGSSAEIVEKVAMDLVAKNAANPMALFDIPTVDCSEYKTDVSVPVKEEKTETQSVQPKEIKEVLPTGWSFKAKTENDMTGGLKRYNHNAGGKTVNGIYFPEVANQKFNYTKNFNQKEWDDFASDPKTLAAQAYIKSLKDRRAA